jgi:unsaturated rhamnogalacturonyl hydrolase
MAAALVRVQGADGLWRSSLLDADEDPNPESTGTGMYTFGLAFGVRTGLLPRAAYLPAVQLGWQGLATISQQPSGMVGWCQPVGAAPGGTNATTTSDFCVGQFLLAGAEVIKLFAAAAA